MVLECLPLAGASGAKDPEAWNERDEGREDAEVAPSPTSHVSPQHTHTPSTPPPSLYTVALWGPFAPLALGIFAPGGEGRKAGTTGAGPGGFLRPLGSPCCPMLAAAPGEAGSFRTPPTRPSSKMPETPPGARGR